MSEAKPGPHVWGEAPHLGTAQEEFDVATGYWRKWQRCKKEREELLEACNYLLAHDDNDPDSGLDVNTYAEAWAMMERAVEKAEGQS